MDYVACYLCLDDDLAWMTTVIPVIYTYKACFYQRVAGNVARIQQQVGEYDIKGRWYKY